MESNRSDSATGLNETYGPLPRVAALREAHRCLFCYDAPCTHACPTHIDIPGFIKKISTDNLLGSAQTILESNLLGATCSRVCPVQELCEGACVLGPTHATRWITCITETYRCCILPRPLVARSR
jgi:glutamate synthase (NADPH/NADH) small chain